MEALKKTYVYVTSVCGEINEQVCKLTFDSKMFVLLSHTCTREEQVFECVCNAHRGCICVRRECLRLCVL